MSVSLVTGGAGFIGSHVVNDLLKLGHKVIVLDDLSGGFKENINPKAIFVQGSIVDHQLVDDLFEEHQFDYVYHLAAYAAEGLSHFIRRFNYTNNLIGSVNLINASIKNKIKLFVFTSSIAVYGQGQLPMIESLDPKPEDPYGVAKLAVEMDLKSAKEMFGLNYVIYRPHNVYGEYQNIGDKYRNVVGIFMNQLLQNKPLTVFGDGSQTRAFSYVGDISPIIASSYQNKACYNEVFNVGADQNFTVKQLAETIMEVMHIQSDIRFLPSRNEVAHAYADHSKVKSTFNIQKDNYTTLNQGLKKMAAWVEKVGSKKSDFFKGIEITENLPTVWLEN